MSRWRDKRLETVKGSTVLREVNLYRNLFKTAKREWHWMDNEPFSGVRLPDEPEGRTQVWRWQQIRLILRRCQTGGPKQQELGRAFHIALRTAMRLSEVLAAKLHGNVALLPKDKTTKGPVKVPLTSHGVRLLRDCPPFTVGANEASGLFSDLTLSLGLREEGDDDALTFHDSRATALTMLARRVNVMTLSRISRHKDINILNRVYYRETAEQIAARL